MALQDFHSPESTVTSLLASSGHLRGSLRPEPPPSIRYGDRDFESATAALDAYIADFERSSEFTSTARLQLRKGPAPVRRGIRNKDVLHEQLTDWELDSLTLPVDDVHHRDHRDPDRLSLTTDDLLVLPCDGSLPVTCTSAFLSQSGHRPRPWSSARTPCALRPHDPHRPSGQTGRTSKPGTGAAGTRDQDPRARRRHRRDPTSALAERGPPDAAAAAASPHHYPRWLTSQKSEMDFSGISSIPDTAYPAWLQECGLPAATTAGAKSSRKETRTGGQTLVSGPPSPRPPPLWLGQLEASREELQRDGDGGGHLCDADGWRGGGGGGGGGGPASGGRSLRELRVQFAERLALAGEADRSADLDDLFRDDKIGGLILKAEKVLNSPSLGLGDPRGQDDAASPPQKTPGSPQQKGSPACTEDGLEADRSWDNPPFTFKSPVPVGGADDPDPAEEPPSERKEEAALGSCSSGYSSRKHPGPVEALKQMLFSLQAVEQQVSLEETAALAGARSGGRDGQVGENDDENTGKELEDCNTAPGGQSLERALHHLRRLKSLVEDTKDHKDTQEGEDA